MKLSEPSDSDIKFIHSSLNKQFPTIPFQKILTNYTLLSTNKKEYFILSSNMAREYSNLKNIDKYLRHIGIYFGRTRKEFGLALESLDFIVQNITKDILVENSIRLTSSESKKFLYGKSQSIKKNKFKNDSIDILEKKKLILDELGDVIGIGIIKVIKEVLELHPIVDLGQYLRSENTGMFGK